MKTEPSLLDSLAPLDATGRPVDLRAARLLARLPKRHLPEYQALVREAEAKLPDWQRAIIERIEGAVKSPLTAGDCWYIAEALREHWLPKDHGRAFDRLHRQAFVDEMNRYAKWCSKQVPKVEGWFTTRNGIAKRYRQSVKTMERWLTRVREERKKLRAEK